MVGHVVHRSLESEHSPAHPRRKRVESYLLIRNSCRCGDLICVKDAFLKILTTSQSKMLAMNALQLRQNITDELEFEPRIDAAHIGVAVDKGA
jgi:hypothetical protein